MNCPDCTLNNPQERVFDRRRHIWLKSLCYCCSNSVDNKPRTMAEVSLISFKELEYSIFMLNEKVSRITNSNLVLNGNYIDNVYIRKQVL